MKEEIKKMFLGGAIIAIFFPAAFIVIGCGIGGDPIIDMIKLGLWTDLFMLLVIATIIGFYKVTGLL